MHSQPVKLKPVCACKLGYNTPLSVIINSDPSPPPQQSPPPKPKKQTEVSQARGCRRLTQFHNQAPTASVITSLSTRNREMEVKKSIIGYSVSPILKTTKRANGQSVLCLDGGGIKVRYNHTYNVMRVHLLTSVVLCFSFIGACPDRNT